jgi:hypothetical protein
VCDNLSYFVKRQTVIDCETIRKDRSGQKIAFRIGRLPQENRLGIDRRQIVAPQQGLTRRRALVACSAGNHPASNAP